MLVKGDLVRLVSPASFPDPEEVRKQISILESWGLHCDTGQYVLSQRGYMAGHDSERLDDLNDAYRDPRVRAVIATRGGAGAYRIADDIDFNAVCQDPKPLIGFSDITSLHLALYKNCAIGNIHGCLYGEKATRTVRHLLMGTEPLTLCRDLNTVSAKVIFPGTAKGRLVGGNLQTLANSVGIRMPDMRGAILFLEHHRIGGLGIVDRCITQLLRSGALDGIVGVVLGSFEGLRDHVDRSWNVVDVLNDRLGGLNIPVLGGIYAGHNLSDENENPDQYSFPLGSTAVMEAERGSLTVEPIVYKKS